MTLKEACSIFAIFFVVCFIGGFMEARHELEKADHNDAGEIRRGLDYQPNSGQLEFKCPDTGVLFRYVVDKDHKFPDETHISKFEERPKSAISAIPIPTVSSGAVGGLVGILGGGSLLTRVRSGNATTVEFALVAAGLGSGAIVGYYAGYHVLLPTSCDDGAKFVKRLRETDWKKIAATYFGRRFDDLHERCEIALNTSEADCSKSENELASSAGTQQNKIHAKVRCSLPPTTEDFRWLLDKEKRCSDGTLPRRQKPDTRVPYQPSRGAARPQPD